MAVTSLINSNPKVYQHFGAMGTPAFTATAGAAVSEGALLKDDGAGLLIHATAATDELVGVAASAATATGQIISVIPWFPGIIFVMIGDHNATAGSHVSAVTDNWVKSQFGIDAGNGRFFFDYETATNAQLVQVGLLDPAGTVRGRILVSPVFNPTNSGSVWAV